MATLTIDVNELPARYAEAVARAQHGDEVIVTATGADPVKIVPVPVTTPKREWVFNMNPGAVIPAPDFDDPLPDEFWLGGSP
ncbi:MAG: hypothetical protein FJ304_09895 [Planctomycetes bacterium]|nr:hypothetical protein [Planctomycetota bacterium]